MIILLMEVFFHAGPLGVVFQRDLGKNPFDLQTGNFCSAINKPCPDSSNDYVLKIGRAERSARAAIKHARASLMAGFSTFRYLGTERGYV